MSQYFPGLYSDVQNIVSTTSPLPSTYTSKEISSVLQSVENILLADWSGAELAGSKLGIIISKVQMTLLDLQKLSSPQDIPASLQLETCMRECQRMNYSDAVQCVRVTRDIFIQHWGKDNHKY